MKKYELMMIFKPFLSEEVRKKSQEKIEKLIEKFGGNVNDTDIWGKRHLAYEIDGNEEGYYMLLEFTLSPEKAVELNEELSGMNDILRFIITKV